jgi:dynein heavy chain 1
VGRLREKKLNHNKDLSVIEYCSNPNERLDWLSHGLPPDNLCVENAIMFKKFNRYPLIIDPSGQATAFLLKQYKHRNIQRTSFLDTAFLKNLETALRFGNALLVEDVESIDATVNSVLNKEIFRQGGRVMINLGAKEIDFSPSFVIFMSTRDPNSHFTPDLCSRVTFVNFTVTHSSLSSQCLSLKNFTQTLT